MIDPWKHLRKNLFRAVEPEVKLVAITQPVDDYKNICNPETLPAFTARESHESKGTIEDDKRLNRTLVSLNPPHDTPLQAVNFVFYVSGVTKSLQAQWTRHKVGVGWTFRSTRYVPAGENQFVYPTYDYIDDEEKVKKLLRLDEETAKKAIETFALKRSLGATKEDSRRVMPVEFATSCYFYVNARALRHQFNIRLRKAAEWEIRRLTQMLFDICMEWAPSLFEDFTKFRQEL